MYKVHLLLKCVLIFNSKEYLFLYLIWECLPIHKWSVKSVSEFLFQRKQIPKYRTIFAHRINGARNTPKLRHSPCSVHICVSIVKGILASTLNITSMSTGSRFWSLQPWPMITMEILRPSLYYKMWMIQLPRSYKTTLLANSIEYVVDCHIKVTLFICLHQKHNLHIIHVPAVAPHHSACVWSA